MLDAEHTTVLNLLHQPPKPHPIRQIEINELGGSRSIVLTGWWPFLQEDLERIVEADHRVYCEISPQGVLPDFVVIGWRDFNEHLIRRLIVTWGMRSRYLPQEAFLDHLLFGHDWYDYTQRLEQMAEYHAGLQVLQSCQGFEWPGIEAPESTGLIGTDDTGFAEETELKRLGYQITGLDSDTRWEILTTRALPRLGLQNVAETIASHVRVRKTNVGGRVKFRHAIVEWEHDLERLKREYYTGNFRWPSYEP